MAKSFLFLGAVLVAALLLFGCTSQPNGQAPAGSDSNVAQGNMDISPAQGDSGAGTIADSATPSHAVIIQNFHFNPESVTIRAGDKVVWSNFDGSQHTVVSDIGIFDSGLMPKGKTFEYIFAFPGTYSYHCGVHSSMTGTIIVQ